MESPLPNGSRRAVACRWREERGLSLVVAVLVLGFLSIVGTSLTYFGTRTTKSASFQAEGQSAADLADAGMNAARSVLFQKLAEGIDLSPDDPSQSAAAILAAADGPGTLTIPGLTDDGTTITYWGSYAGGVWTVYGKASSPNPSGSGQVVRQVESQLQAGTTPGGPATISLWDYSLSAVSPGECMEVANNAIVRQPLKVIGDMCVENNGHFIGHTLVVTGETLIKNNGTVGSDTTHTQTSGHTDEHVGPITSAQLIGGCRSNNGGGDLHSPCTSDDRVYATTITNAPTTLTKPTVDFGDWWLNASPGPKSPCTVASGTPPAFDTNAAASSGPDGSISSWTDITPSSSYTCKTASGELSWNVATRTLTISGVIFIDGKVRLDNNDFALYQGRGTLYTYGEFEISNNARLCGSRAAGDVGTASNYCTAAWDPGVNALVIVARRPGDIGFRISNNAVYQGGAYVEGHYEVSNNGANWGPVIADDFEAENNATLFFSVPAQPGVPDWGTPTATMTAPVQTLTNVAGSYRLITPD